MRRSTAIGLLIFSIALTVSSSAIAARPAPIYGYIPMSDGVSLKYQALLPDPGVWGPGPYPLVMDYSGYIPSETIYDSLHHRFREAGYAVIGLNIRGTHCSGGYFDYFEPRQSLDGKEAVEYLTQDPTRPSWSNGKLAMVGKSYPGITQLFVAALQPKGLVAIVPGHVFGDLYRDVPFPGGILNATFAGAWSGQRAAETMYSGYYWWLRNPDDTQCLNNQPDHAPNTAVNPFVQATYNQFDGPLFWQRSPWWWADKIDVPTLLVESWQDEQVGSRATHLLDRFREGLPWKFIAANGDHGEYYGPEMLTHIYRFLEFTLKGNDFVPGDFYTEYENQGVVRNLGFADASPAQYWAEDPVIINFENGALGGRNSAFTKTFSSWPPPQQTLERLYLTTDGALSPNEPEDLSPPSKIEATNARLAGAVDYVYAPYVGTQERGGADIEDIYFGDWQRRPPEGTFAAFTTEPFTSERVLLGTASVDLFISSTAPDTDLQVTLTEVRPDGKEMFVQKGWLRASHRMEDARFSTPLRPFQTHRIGDTSPLVPGHPTAARVEIFPFGHVFRAGSRLRISIEAPNILPDLWGFAALPSPAVNTIYASSFYPSSIALPVLSGVTSPTGLPPCTLRNQPCRPEVP